MKRRFSDELQEASSFAEASEIIAALAGAGAVPIVIDEISSRAAVERRPRVRLRYREIEWLLRQVEQTSVAETLAARTDVLQKLEPIIATRSWTERERLLARHESFDGQSPATALTWILGTERRFDENYLLRLASWLRKEPQNRLRMLVEDLSGLTERSDQFNVLARYADVLNPPPQAAEIKKAFSDSYHGWTVKVAEREYIKLLIRWASERGVEEASEALDRHANDVLALIVADDDDDREAVLQRLPHIGTRDSITLIDYWLALDKAMSREQIDLGEHAREILRIAIHRPAAAVSLAMRKHELTMHHLTRLVTARTLPKQAAILRRHDDLLRSALALRLIDRIGEIHRESSPASVSMRARIERMRVLLTEAMTDDVEGAIHLFETFDLLLEILEHHDEALVKAIEENQQSIDFTMDRALTLLGEITIRSSAAFAPALLRFGLTVSTHFSSDEDVLAFAVRAVELARTDEKLSAVQRTFSEYVRGCLYEREGNLAGAVESLERALAAYTEHDLTAGMIIVQSRLADLYATHRSGEDWFTRVRAHGTAALELLRAHKDLPATGILLTLADTYAVQPGEAERRQAVEWYEELLILLPLDSPFQVRCGEARASLLAALGRKADAIDAYRRSLDLLRRFSESESPSMRAGIALKRRLTITALLDLLLEGKPEAAARIEALQTLDEARGWELRNDNIFSALVLADANPDLPRDVRSTMLSYLQQRYAFREMQPEMLESLDEAYRGLPALFLEVIEKIVKEGRPDNEEEEAAYAWFREVLEFARNASPEEMAAFEKAFAELPDFMTAIALNAVRDPSALSGSSEESSRDVRPARGATWDEIQALFDLLGERAAGVTYLVGEHRSHCLLVRSGLEAPISIEIPIGEEALLQRYWMSYAREILHGDGTGRTPRHAWQELGQLLLKPLESALRGVDVLYVAPAEQLSWLPFHALTVDGRPYCLLRAAVTVPSLGYLEWRMHIHAPAARLDSVGAVGYTATESERELFEGEAQAVANYFRGTALVGADATRERVTALAGKTDGLLHISAHGRQTDDVDDGPVLYLADGEFSTFDWMSGVHSAVRLCTFSACDTGRNQRTPMKPYFGFPRAALLGGARAVLAPLWAVDAKKASDFCLAFYEMTWDPDGRQKLPLAEGYRRTLAAQAERSDWTVRDWASFALAGDGR